MLVSQPLAIRPSQSANPALQRILQAPAEQIGTALGTGEHTTPQVPQLFTLVLTFVSQPLAALPSQSANPALQRTITHWPAVHEGVALGKEHAFPQLPQLLISLLVSATSNEPALVVWPLETTTLAFLATPLCGSATTKYVPGAT